MEKHAPFRRLVLGSLALAMLGGPAAASGCAADFAPISEIDGLRVLAVEADKPYAAPGETVKLAMTHVDSRPDAPNTNVFWIGGCYNPPGDLYYACYEQLRSRFPDLTNIDALIQSGLGGIGSDFSLTLPNDLITSRPEPADGAPWYGVAFVFFVACNGYPGLVPPEGTGEAGYFPIGCFDRPHTEKGAQRLGAANFVPGYTQIYAFADGRRNENPTILGMKTKDDLIFDDKPEEIRAAEPCPVSENDRHAAPGCGRPDPTKDCTVYDISVEVPKDVAEIDPSAKQADGKPLRETVWVDYFADRGTFTADAKLVSDAVEGYRPEHEVGFIPPPDPGPVRVWAVVHDNRGGQSVIDRTIMVK